MSYSTDEFTELKERLEKISKKVSELETYVGKQTDEVDSDPFGWPTMGLKQVLEAADRSPGQMASWPKWKQELSAQLPEPDPLLSVHEFDSVMNALCVTLESCLQLMNRLDSQTDKETARTWLDQARFFLKKTSLLFEQIDANVPVPGEATT